jgi:hypothetical protein
VVQSSETPTPGSSIHPPVPKKRMATTQDIQHIMQPFGPGIEENKNWNGNTEPSKWENNSWNKQVVSKIPASQ